ncbi:MAG: cytochrome c3 family protein [Deltaproteobacteria bacterium]|nr:cytochrome c3 family protein [Deltaproteobacteria bacterium]
MFKTNRTTLILMLSAVTICGLAGETYAGSGETRDTQGRVSAEISTLTSRKPRFSSSDCLACHGVRTEGIPYVDEGHFESSVHNELACTDCHDSIKVLPHPEKLPAPNCGRCHGDIEAQYKNSIHGQAVKNGISKAAHCWSCHGKHDILAATNPSSTVYPQNLPSTCGTCHNSEEMAKEYNIPVSTPYQLYEKSIHAVALKEGLPAATCSDCHGSHNILPMNITASTISKANIPRTCSQCHPDEYKNYIQSSHWKAFQQGIQNAPVCTDCHAEHAILSKDNPSSPIYPLNVPKTCTDCHGRVQLAESFGLPAVKLSSYMKSFHGVMIEGGSVIAANCASCHRAHKILPPSNPESSVCACNLPKTCGQCHKGITRADVKHLKDIHGAMGVSKGIIDLIRKLYIYLISVTVIGMLVFVYADFIRKIINKEKERIIKLDDKGDYVRFTPSERAMHTVHLFAFFVLAYTGFAHHWPDYWWSAWLTHMDNGLVRAWIHRISGVVLLGVFVLQFALMMVTERGKEQLKALMPVFDDVKGAIGMFLYNIGLTDKKPAFSRFTPFEKFEYWALVWGNTLMGITGMALWFTTGTLALLPKWYLDLFILIHFYEAILATLAILIWHLYWVVFDPIMYPYNPSIFTGKLSVNIMEEEHPLESTGHVSKGEPESNKTEVDQYRQT